MNEQEMIINEKIKKREKVDTILAYMLIVILFGAIFIVLYLKFIKKSDEEIIPEEYTPTYISLDELSNSLNSSDLVTIFRNDNATLTSSANNNNLNINYVKSDNDVTFNIPLVGNELQIEYKEEDKSIGESLYKELATIICVYNGNIEDSCRNTINSVGINNQIEGIRIIEKENNTTVYIDIVKKIDVTSIITYTEVTPVDITNTNYILVLDNIQISNININNDATNIVFNGNIKSFNEDNILNVLVKLYDINNNIIGENTYEYTEANPLSGEKTFELSFELNDSLKLENINKYSIEISK